MIRFFRKLWLRFFPPRVVAKPVVPVVAPAPEKPKRKKLKRCPVMHKVMFTHEQANAAADRRRKEAPHLYLRIYCCEFCFCWHLTHHKRRRR